MELDAQVARRRLQRVAWWQARGVEQPDVLDAPDQVLTNLRTSFGDARKRAKNRGLSFTVTWDQIQTLYRMQGGRCSLSGLAFTVERTPGAVRRPFAPSLDRLNCAKGYTPTNVRLVCAAVNIAMNEWGLSVLFKIAEGLLGNKQMIAPRRVRKRVITKL